MALESIDAGVWSLVPAILAISLAWTTRDALIGLFVGVASTGPIYGALRPGADAVGVPPDLVGTPVGNALGALFGLKLIPTLVATAPLFSDAWYVENVLLAIFAIGGMIGLMIRAGAIQGVLEALAERADSPADAEKAAYIAGVAVHIDDYFNCLVVGSMMRPLTDKYDVSRAKLAYYVDSAGSPAARLAFYSTWGAALIGFIGGGLTEAQRQNVLPENMGGFVQGTGESASAVTAEIWPLFFNSLFFGFYSWIALVLAGLVAWQVFPNIFGMGREESRARSGGGVVGPDQDPMISEEIDEYEMSPAADPDWRNFAVPVATMILVGLGAMFWRGSPVVTVPGETSNLLFALGDYQLLIPPAGPWAFNIGGVKLGLAATAALVVAAVLYRLRGDIPSNDEATDAMVRGFKGIFLAALILTLASSIQNSVTVLGISGFVTDWFRGVPAGLVPVLLFFATAGISFADGSSWSTYGIMFPIAIPVAFTTGANLPLVLGAVFSGGIFGDHSSPISDTTVLASSTSGSDHLVHVRTQIPYAVITATIAAVLFVLFGYVLPQGFEVIPY
ncbi:Na+/H+ antiporter NhaC family protein [Halorussus sp. MSC15.2]|uniref:Na+/H+ antiporter NhaC family protein n=1 Tax=Halorussus sp. MSC15.2 TaxID=2283638 RepID=UPI0013D3ECF6|nr:Na+/H+ antiporter NhaC family protein [Halorussus sp. MSC15.2]NEU56089.1 sodium:proton antiporter [Halorussus sp. MSC15.2]